MQYSVEDIIAPRRRRAEDILNFLLETQMPPENLLAEQYGKKVSPFIQDRLDEYLTSVDGLKPRDPVSPDKTELFQKRQLLQNRPEFDDFRKLTEKIEDAIKQGNLMPNESELKPMFGDFAKEVARHYSLYKRMGLLRICDLLYPVHCHRCAGASIVLGFEELPSGMPKDYYATLWAMHDDEEEIMPGFKLQDGHVVFGLEGLDHFRQEYFPSELFPPSFINDISYLTNYGRTIMKYLDKVLDITPKNIDDLIASLDLLNNPKYNAAREEIDSFRKFAYLLKKRDPNMQRDDYFKQNFSVVQYRDDFLEDLKQKAVNDNNLRLFEGKGTVDIYDGLVSKLAQNLPGKRDGVRKMMDWVRKSKELTGKLPMFDNKVPQCVSMANFTARDLAIQYLAEQLSEQDHVTSAVNSLVAMKDALYETF